MTFPAAAPTIAISATFTAEPVEESLRFWKEELGWVDTIRFAPFNQVFQQLLDPASLLAGNRAGVNVLLIRLEDWLRSGDEEAALSRQFVEAARAASAAWPVPLLVVFCPDSPAADYEPVRERIGRELAEASTVHMVTPEELLALYPVETVHDPHGDELGRVPYTPEFFAALGTLIARRIHALRMKPFKVIALDCDDTLWRGVCGEDGPEGVELDPPRRALQQFMLRQHDAGMLLCLASKNNAEDVFETFRAHPEMPLRLEHFVSHRINWDSKGHNLRALANELQLGLDSFILIDDNPKECGEASTTVPEILALPLPAEADEIPEFLQHVWAFDHLRVTGEDRRRAAMYRAEIERGRLERQAASLEDFLRSLRLEVRIEPAAADQLPRVAQLTARTNQMNFSTVRRTEGEVREFLRQGGECLVATVEDRFGGYGLTGVILFTSDNGALKIDTFLASCRVLGRGVEHRMFRRLGEIALERGLKRVEAIYAASPRNRPALLFLESFASQYHLTRSGGMRFLIPAEVAAALEYRPVNGKPAYAAAPAAPAQAIEPRLDYARIARESRSARTVLERMRERRAAPEGAKNTGIAPRTELERELAAMWAELLGVRQVGIDRSFFDLGGHSLMAVQLLSRVRDRYGVNLSLEVVYSGEFNVAELARAIELNQIEQAGGTAYGDLLREVERLTDEEVRAMLDQEEPSRPA